MSFIDFHCDTLEMFAVTETPSGDLYSNDRSVDFRRMKKVGMKAQFFAMWLPVPGMAPHLKHPGVIKNGELWDEGYLRTLYAGFKNTVGSHEDMVMHTVTWEDYQKALTDGKMAAFLTVEDGRVVNGKMENIKALYDGGVSLISLTWNQRNCFGSPNSRDEQVMTEGLTDFGKEAVEYMNELGMLVDVSHLSDGGFYDVAAVSKNPFVASHSNARAMSPHQRNLTDEMIRILADKGGILGLNYCPAFLSADSEGEESKIEDMVRHLTYIKNVGGTEILALGGDLDGIGGKLEIDSIDKTVYLFDALEKQGFTARELDGLACRNAERVLRESLA